MTADEKWQIVKTHYESSYRHPETNRPIRFTRRLEEPVVDSLYNEMCKLGYSERIHIEKKRS